MHRGTLNDSVKFYAVSQGVHGAIFVAGVPLAAKEYWLFPLLGLPVGAFFFFDKVTIRALKESKPFRFALEIEVAVIWVMSFVTGWLPMDGTKEAFVLLSLWPAIWIVFRTNKELRKVVMKN